MAAVTDRRAGILRIIVREYVETAAPVGSRTIHDKYGVSASPATIRHEMQALEEEGLLEQPHTSAGRVPSDRGYRMFVESLMGQTDLPVEEKATIRHQFYQAAPELDEWADLAAALLARSLGLLALVSPPRSRELRVKHLELIGLNEILALLVVVLREARVLKQLVPLDGPFEQAELSVLAARLNERVSGRTVTELRREPAVDDATEQRLIETLTGILSEESAREAAVRVEGVAGMLGQPEFRQDHRGLLDIVTLVDQRATDRVVPPESLGGDGVSVMIGDENPAGELQHCSVVVAPYGDRADMSGYVAVVGPTRMRYARGVATVRYLSGLLEEMMDRVYG